MSTAVRPYHAVFRARFYLLLQYRAAAFAGFVTQLWWGVVKIMVFAAFFRGAASAPMTLRQAIDYIWLAQALLTLLPWSVDPDFARAMTDAGSGRGRCSADITAATFSGRAASAAQGASITPCCLSYP